MRIHETAELYDDDLDDYERVNAICGDLAPDVIPMLYGLWPQDKKRMQKVFGKSFKNPVESEAKEAVSSGESRKSDIEDEEKKVDLADLEPDLEKGVLMTWDGKVKPTVTEVISRSSGNAQLMTRYEIDNLIGDIAFSPLFLEEDDVVLPHLSVMINKIVDAGLGENLNALKSLHELYRFYCSLNEVDEFKEAMKGEGRINPKRQDRMMARMLPPASEFEAEDRLNGRYKNRRIAGRRRLVKRDPSTFGSGGFRNYVRDVAKRYR